MTTRRHSRSWTKLLAYRSAARYSRAWCPRWLLRARRWKNRGIRVHGRIALRHQSMTEATKQRMWLQDAMDLMHEAIMRVLPQIRANVTSNNALLRAIQRGSS